MKAANRSLPLPRSKPAQFLVWVILPSLLLAIYLTLIATEQYESEARFVIRSLDLQSSAQTGLVQALVADEGGVESDTAILQAFIESADLVALLDEQLGLRERWSSPEIDTISRLSPAATFDGLHAFFLDHVDVTAHAGGILTVRVRSFEAEEARDILDHILKEAEQFINQISRKLADEQIAYLREQISGLESNLAAIRTEQREFENEQGSLNLSSDMEMIYGNIGALEREKANQEAELDRLRSFLSPSAASIRTLQAEIAALNSQIRAERQRLVGSDESINAILARSQTLQLEEEFARNAYAAAFQTLETARLEAVQKFKTLVRIQGARTPEETGYPRTGYLLLTTVLVLSLLFAIGHMILAVVDDHRTA